MTKFDFGNGVTRHIETTQTQARDLDTINPEDVVKVVKITLTVWESLKVLVAAFKNLFKPQTV